MIVSEICSFSFGRCTAGGVSATTSYLSLINLRPTEHGYIKKVTEEMYVYSFGVVLLKLITGRQAEPARIEDSADVVKWAQRKINTVSGAYQVLDPKISSSCQGEMLRAREVVLRCTSIMPEKRPTMSEVIRLLLIH